MTERRPHWDDDLIEAVSSALENPFHDEMVYAIIAAVEDWQVANARDRVYLAEPTSAEQAAIARVRDLHEKHDCSRHEHSYCGNDGICRWCLGEYPCPTIRALDGDGDE